MKKFWNILLLLFIFSSCQEKWDNYYGEGEEDDRAATSKVKLWDRISENPDYSKFKKMLEKVGMDEELKRERVLTVWLPLNDYITDDITALDSFDMRRFVLNHINALALYKTKLGSKNEILTLAKKYLSIDGTGDYVQVEELSINKFDIVCVNGVIHELKGYVNPKKNVMEHILEAGEEYSIYRDSLLARNDTVFDIEESFPIGVNEVGQTIYDSVFDISNELLGYVDFADEKKTSTLFLASDSVIHNMLNDVKIYLELLGITMTKQDTNSCLDFLMKASFLGSEQTIFGAVVYTAGGSELRLESNKQRLSTDYEQCSNGVVFEFERAYLPRNQFMKTITYETVSLFELAEDEWSEYYYYSFGGDSRELNNGHTANGTNVDSNIFADGNNAQWEFLSVEANEGDYLDLVLLQKDIYGEVLPARLMPGTYKLTGKGYSWNASNVKIKLNGSPLAYFGEDLASWNGGHVFPMGQRSEAFAYENDNFKPMCDTVHVFLNPNSQDVIRIESTGTGQLKNNIKIRALKFEPVGDNY